MMKDSTFEVETPKVRFVKPDVAIVDTEINIQNMKAPDGTMHAMKAMGPTR